MAVRGRLNHSALAAAVRPTTPRLATSVTRFRAYDGRIDSASRLASLAKAKGFPWNVLAGSLEYDGLEAHQLATEVTKARLCQFQSMITSPASAD